MTVYVDVHDDVYAWLLEWATSGPCFAVLKEEDPDRVREKHSLWAIMGDLLETFWPTGRAIPRALELGVSDKVKPHRVSWRDEKDEEKSKDLAARPARGESVGRGVVYKRYPDWD